MKIGAIAAKAPQRNMTPIKIASFDEQMEKMGFLKDIKAGTFAQLVTAAERCPAGFVHPGTPVNAKEKDLEKRVKRA